MSRHHHLRCCHCSSARIDPGDSIAPTQTAPPYAPPTAALLLRLSNFTTSMMRVQQQAPHLHTLLARSASMRLQWQEDAVGPLATSPLVGASAAPCDAAESSVLRLLGLCSSEQEAARLRAQLLHQAQVATGLGAPPAAVYPPAFGRARLELATNSLALHQACRSRCETLHRTHPRAVQHLNAPVFLEPQVAMHANPCPAASPFLAVPRPPLQCHSSVPLSTDEHRTRYLQSIVQHVAERLAFRTPFHTPSGPAATSPPAHIFVLHLDAHALLGHPQSSLEIEQHASIALRFIDQLIAALMAQLENMPDDSTHAVASPAVYPPTFSQLAPPVPFVPSASSSCAHLSSPLHAASALLDSSSVACSQLMWGVLLDQEEASTAHPQSAAIDSDVASLLAALRPVQSYQVQDGVVDPRKTGWSSCTGYVCHSDSTRTSPSFELASASSSPIQGALHISHLIKEIVFKLGLGNKYGA